MGEKKLSEREEEEDGVLLSFNRRNVLPSSYVGLFGDAAAASAIPRGVPLFPLRRSTQRSWSFVPRFCQGVPRLDLAALHSKTKNKNKDPSSAMSARGQFEFFWQ
jgi:hypothetical protein